MQYLDQLMYEREDHRTNSKLYEFLATTYDISDLAQKICAAKNAQISLMNLKRMRVASSA